MKRLTPLLLTPLLLSAGTPAGSVIENIGVYEDESGRIESRVSVTVLPVCAASLTPERTGRAVRVGEGVTAPYVLTNTGNATATFPVGLTQPGNGAPTFTVVADTNGNGLPDEAPTSSVTLAPDGSVTLLVSATPLRPGVWGTTLVTGCEGDLSAALTVTASIGAPEISKVVEGDTTAEVGGLVRYTVTVVNPERVTMPDVRIEDVLSPALEFVAVEGATGVGATALDGGSTRVAWETTLAPGERRVYTLVARVRAGVGDDTEVANVATATGEGGSDTSTPPALVRVFSSRLLVSKAVSAAVVDPGGVVTYTVTVVNPAETTLQGTVVQDTPDSRLEVLTGTVRVNGTPVTATLAGGVLTVPVGTLAPRATATITYDARLPLVSDGTPVNNTVEARARGRQGTVVADVKSNVASARVALRRTLAGSGNDLVGRVFVDVDGDADYTGGTDRPVPRARVLLAGGREALTDAAGLYSFKNVVGGLNGVRLDPRSVPYVPAPPRAAPQFAAPGSATPQVVALTVLDFPLQPNRLGLSASSEVRLPASTHTFTPRAADAGWDVVSRAEGETCVTLAGRLVRLPAGALVPTPLPSPHPAATRRPLALPPVEEVPCP
ncbi:hypothetical protein V3W47_04255 [Deinococcus sp. YIM 134068]|uniref:hypothetical protein n=1 Tax=Deinococcus lichenicola TaxID=3118910 RepID=UPI002F9520D4